MEPGKFQVTIDDDELSTNSDQASQNGEPADNNSVSDRDHEEEQFELVESKADPKVDGTIIKAKYVCVHSRIHGAITQLYCGQDLMW